MGMSFFVSGGVDDDVHVYSLQNGVWAEQARSPLALAHGGVGVGLSVKPQAAGIATPQDVDQIIRAEIYGRRAKVLECEGPRRFEIGGRELLLTGLRLGCFFTGATVLTQSSRRFHKHITPD
jgi:hypothetical protein